MLRIALYVLLLGGLDGQTVEPFEFHSNFWTNLHHFLFQQGLSNAQVQGLTPEDAASWNRAVQFYKRTLVSHDLLFDQGMREIETALARAEGRPSIEAGPGLSTELRDVLSEAAPIYKDRWWPQHDRANRLWIDLATPLVRNFGSELVNETSAAYESPWPQRPVRVDVVEYTNWGGAYTFTDESVHSFVSSASPANQGFAALEVLFHEATHGIVEDDAGRLADEISKDGKALHKRNPKNLVHAVIFFTAGELTRRALAEVGVDYEPYAMKNGLYARAGWTHYVSALDLFWARHLDGGASLEQAVRQIVEALQGPY
jgi:hypothetical protein